MSEINGVPRSEAEEEELLRTRPPGWEYLLFGGVLLRGKDALEPRWREQVEGSPAVAEPVLTDLESLDALKDPFRQPLAITSDLERLFGTESLELALGKLGEDGDPDRIRHLAQGVIDDYRGFFDWSARVRAIGVAARFQPLVEITARYADLPLRQIREWIDKAVMEFDRLPAALRSGTPITLSLTLKLDADEAVSDRLRNELQRVQAEIQAEADALPSPSEDDHLAQQRGASTGGGGFHPIRDHRAKSAQRQFASELENWEHLRQGSAECLAMAQSWSGDVSPSLMLKQGETIFGVIKGAALIEDRRGPGSWQGRSQGVSFPVASLGGRSIRYRVGSSRGHFVQGAAVPTAIDTGTLYLTNQRVVFQGVKQTRECRFDKLVGFQHTTDGSTIFSVSNRQKPTTINYGPELSAWLDFRLDLAMAHYRGTTAQLVAQLQSDLAAIDAARPQPPPNSG